MIDQVISSLELLKEDLTIPKNVKEKVENSIIYLKEKDVENAVKVDKVIQELDDLSSDPNLPNYLKTQLWNILSLLESV